MKPLFSTSASLVSQLVSRIDPPQKKGIEEVYAQVIGRLRRFSVASIIDVALSDLWEDRDRIETVKNAPWLTLLLVKWALQDNRVQLLAAREISSEDFLQVKQILWEAANNTAVQFSNVFLMLRAIVYPQMEFQRRTGRAFLRWAALYERERPGTVPRSQFTQAMGVQPGDYIDVVVALYSCVLQGQAWVDNRYLALLRRGYGETLDHVLSLFSRDIATLRTELQQAPAQKVCGAGELFEFPYVRRFPLFAHRSGRSFFWHPLVLARGAEEFVHARMSDYLGKPYIDSFSKLFEKYVVEVAMASGLEFRVEEDIKRRFGRDSRAVEIVLRDGGCNIFVEAKAGYFRDDVLIQERKLDFSNKAERVREAIRQGRDVAALLKAAPDFFPSQSPTPENFLIVVTSRELLIGSGAMLRRMTGDSVWPDDAEGDHPTIPLANVIVASIEEFEHVMMAVLRDGISLSDLLKEAASACGSGSAERWFFSDFLSNRVKQWHDTPLIEDAFARSVDRLEAKLGAAEEGGSAQ